MDDIRYMKRALKLAEKARGYTSPNPMVGAVLVKKGHVLAEDYHRKAGTPHAEALVISEAGEKSAGATLYVNLEPCCHTKKRTPPCTNSISKSGIRRIVIGMLDPNPEVSGRGVKQLRKAGIEVSVGTLESEARKLNEAYIKHITTGMPFVILKTAMTLDGKIATPTGESKWITGEAARKLVHKTRSGVDAILTAIGTVKADDPELTARIRGGRNPLKVVIDPSLEMSPTARVLSMSPETIVVTRAGNKSSKKYNNTNVKIITFKEKLELKRLLKRLGKRGIISVLIEGGSSLNAYALNEGIVDRVMFFLAPKIIGGKDSYPSVGGKTYKNLENAHMIGNVKVRKIGDDILIEGDVISSS